MLKSREMCDFPLVISHFFPNTLFQFSIRWLILCVCVFSIEYLKLSTACYELCIGMKIIYLNIFFYLCGRSQTNRKCLYNWDQL